MNLYSEGLSVVLPVFNEEAAIADTLERVVGYLTVKRAEFEVIVVDDGSRDRSGVIIKEVMTRFSRIKLVQHPLNKGYGEALRSGFNAATLKWVLLMDADGQFRIESIENLLPYTDKFSIVVGYRQNRADGWWRNLFSRGYTLVINLLFGLWLKDIGCGFKLFERATWIDVSPIVSRDHKIFTVEWMWRLKHGKVAIKQVAVNHFLRRGGKPTGAQWGVVWQMLKALVALRWRRRASA